MKRTWITCAAILPLLGAPAVSQAMSAASEPIQNVRTIEKTVWERLVVVISNTLEVAEERVTKEARLIEDLGMDSLGLVELYLAIEEEFGIELGKVEMEKFKTCEDVYHLVLERLDQ